MKQQCNNKSSSDSSDKQNAATRRRTMVLLDSRLWIKALWVLLLAHGGPLAPTGSFVDGQQQAQQQADENNKSNIFQRSGNSKNNQGNANSNGRNIFNYAGNNNNGKRDGGNSERPNLLFLICDQLRWDALGYVQKKMASYSNKVKVRTPNIDKLAASGVIFDTAYCVSASCAPSRASLLTGNSMRRTGIAGNKLIRQHAYNKVPSIRERVQASESFEQVLVEKLGYQAVRYVLCRNW